MVITWDSEPGKKLYKEMIEALVEDMEKMAGDTTEERGKRQPGEIGSYERQRYRNLGFKVKMVDGRIEKTPLTPEELEMDEKYANDVLSQFLPKTDSRMPLGSPTEPAGALE